MIEASESPRFALTCERRLRATALLATIGLGGFFAVLLGSEEVPASISWGGLTVCALSVYLSWYAMRAIFGGHFGLLALLFTILSFHGEALRSSRGSWHECVLTCAQYSGVGLFFCSAMPLALLATDKALRISPRVVDMVPSDQDVLHASKGRP